MKNINEVLLLKINGLETPDLYPVIVNLEVEEDEGLASVFSLRLAMHFKTDGTWTQLDDERLKLWNKISISAGFTANLVEIFSGYITRIEPIFDNDDCRCYLDIKGMDRSVEMNLEEKMKAWPGKKDSDIARQIFSTYGFIPKVDNTQALHPENSSTIIQRETDLQFLHRLARRNGFECFLRNNTGYFRPPQLDGKPQKTLALRFGQETDLAFFRVTADALIPTQVGMQQPDILTREKREVSITSVAQKQLGKIPATGLYPPGLGPAKTYMKHSTANGQPAMQALCRSVYDKAEWFLRGEGKISGLLYQDVLRARGTVTIKGIGSNYSGIYYVTKVKHIFTKTGYSQDFQVKRNALQPKGTENFGSGRELLNKDVTNE